jgi:hypothetical protein
VSTLTTGPVDYVVVGEVILGPRASPILAKKLFCTVECAAEGVHDLTAQLAGQEHSSSLTLWSEGRPVGVVVTRGRMWVIRVHASHEFDGHS